MGRQKAKYPTSSFILKYKKADKDAEFLQSTINEEVINRLSFDSLPTDSYSVLIIPAGDNIFY